VASEPIASLIVAALLATSEGKEVSEISGPSRSIPSPKGPSITINGSLPYTIAPSF